MLRIHGLSPEQMGALVRLMADNQSFDEAPPQRGPRAVAGGAAGSDGRGAALRRSGIVPHLRLVQG